MDAAAPLSRSFDDAPAPLRGRNVSLLRGLVLAAVAVVVTWRLTVPLGLVAAALGAFAGALLGDRLSRRPASGPAPRRSVLFGLAAVALFVGFHLARAFVGSELLASLFGPVPALHLGEALLWLGLVLPIVFALRFAAARSEAMAVVEVVFVGGAFAFAFAAHREGMVHRPLAVGDWAWSRGLDPLWIFLGVGLAGTFLLAGLMLREARGERLKLHFGLLLLIALGLFLFVQVKGVPKPDPAGDLGLTGKPKDQEGDQEKEERRGGQGGKSQNQLDELEFKDEYQNQGEQAPVAVVLLHDDYSPPPGAFYFRQTAFSQWNGRRLVAATRDDVDRDVALRFPLEPIEVATAPPVGDGRRALRTTIGLMTDHVRPFALDSPARLEPAHNPDALRFQRVYGVRSHVPILPYDSLLGLAAGNKDWPPEVFEYYTEAPSDPRYAELAEKAVEVLDPKWKDDPLAQALAIKLYLDKNGKYSRKSNHASSPDPTADFLFGDLTGYCVHFAHAAVYLFRTRGIPARVAAGYAVPESERGSGSAILIQGKSAHAWPEIYLDGMGWVVVDIAPETSLDPPDPDSDQKLQQMLGEMLRQSPEDEALRDRLRHQWNPRFWFFWLLLLAVAAGYGVKLYRAFAPQFAGSPRLYRVAYRAALDHLVEAGLARRPGESREDFARRAALLAPSFGGLTRQHLGQALGSRRLEEPGEVQRLLGEVRLELDRNASRARRLLSVLDPFTWLRAR